MKNKLPIHKSIELIFDVFYLVTALILGGILIASAKSNVTILWGIMAIILAFGDAFHLVPRMAAAYTGETLRFAKAMGIGKMITSITMTFFYILLWYAGLELFSLDLPKLSASICILSGIRIAFCFHPRNKWHEGGEDFGIERNVPFAIQGALVMWLYYTNSAQNQAVSLMWIAILLSFACYLPVVIWAKKYPKIGILMLPKTCAYLWIISMGLSLK